jgi:hypothetical protein
MLLLVKDLVSDHFAGPPPPPPKHCAVCRAFANNQRVFVGCAGLTPSAPIHKHAAKCSDISTHTHTKAHINDHRDARLTCIPALHITLALAVFASFSRVHSQQQRPMRQQQSPQLPPPPQWKCPLCPSPAKS